MSARLLVEVAPQTVAALLDSDEPVVVLVAPNFEDRSVHAASWVLDALAGRTESVAAQTVWLQTPGVDDIFDRIKAANRDQVASSFKHLRERSTQLRVDLPASDAGLLLNKNLDLVNSVGGEATLVVDISSLPRTVVRHILDGIVQAHARTKVSGARRYRRVICLYTAAGDYPVGADSDVIGGVDGYFTKRSVHDLISTAGVLDAVISLAGTSHDSAQTLDALWQHGLPASTNISATVLMNRENFVYSYQRLAHAAWTLNQSVRHGTDLVYSFEIADVVRQIFARTENALHRHTEYREAGGEGVPTFLVGGFGPKPLGLAALLASMRYRRVMDSHRISATTDVLQVRGWQYTTRYSHGVGDMKAFEIDLDCLDAPLSTITP